jgi:hypothetical protein
MWYKIQNTGLKTQKQPDGLAVIVSAKQVSGLRALHGDRIKVLATAATRRELEEGQV